MVEKNSGFIAFTCSPKSDLGVETGSNSSEHWLKLKKISHTKKKNYCTLTFWKIEGKSLD